MTRSLEMLEEIAKAATPGRWQWYGNTKQHEVYLSTVTGGRVFVMDFVRWGMTGAQPRFQVRPDDDGEVRRGDRGKLAGSLAPYSCGFMRSVGDLGRDEDPLGPKFAVSYRRQFQGIGHPDATHIAENDPTTTLALIARIRELEAGLREAISLAENLHEDLCGPPDDPRSPAPRALPRLTDLANKGVCL